jgi:hypothetical protein
MAISWAINAAEFFEIELFHAPDREFLAGIR